MKLKTYTAATTAEAMNMVRTELGEDAAIVSIRLADDGATVDVIATLEGASLFDTSTPSAGPARVDIYETVCQALERHGAPGR